MRLFTLTLTALLGASILFGGQPTQPGPGPQVVTMERASLIAEGGDGGGRGGHGTPVNYTRYNWALLNPGSRNNYRTLASAGSVPGAVAQTVAAPTVAGDPADFSKIKVDAPVITTYAAVVGTWPSSVSMSEERSYQWQVTWLDPALTPTNNTIMMNSSIDMTGGYNTSSYTLYKDLSGNPKPVFVSLPEVYMRNGANNLRFMGVIEDMAFGFWYDFTAVASPFVGCSGLGPNGAFEARVESSTPITSVTATEGVVLTESYGDFFPGSSTVYWRVWRGYIPKNTTITVTATNSAGSKSVNYSRADY